MVRISIITPVLNGRPYIGETLASVLSQAGDFELEYIICDGGSTDGTLELLNGYKDRCRVISEPDGSPQEAVNRGMALATGEIGAWLNADDLYLPGALQAVAGLFRRAPDCQWCYGRCRIIDAGSRQIRRPITWYKNLLGYRYSYNILLCENYINQPAVFWKLDLWRQSGGLNTSFRAAWDYELWLRMASLARPRPLRHRLACFRRHEQSISENGFEQQFREEEEIAARYGSRCHRLVHNVNRWKTVCAYRMLNRK